MRVHSGEFETEPKRKVIRSRNPITAPNKPERHGGRSLQDHGTPRRAFPTRPRNATEGVPYLPVGNAARGVPLVLLAALTEKRAVRCSPHGPFALETKRSRLRNRNRPC